MDAPGARDARRSRTTRRCAPRDAARPGGGSPRCRCSCEFLEQARKYVEDRLGADVDAQTADVLDRWESVLTPARDRPDEPVARARLGRQARRCSRATATATASTGTTPALHLVDLQYCDVRPDKGLSHRLQAPRRARAPHDRRRRSTPRCTTPPDDTRAWFRGECLRRYPDAGRRGVLGLGHLRRARATTPCSACPTLEPLRGTKAHVGDLLDRCPTAARPAGRAQPRRPEPSARRTRVRLSAHDEA